MICKACKEKFENMNRCPNCGFDVLEGIVGEQSDEVKKEYEKLAIEYAKEYIGNVKVYIRGYIIQAEDDDFKVAGSQDILIAENINECEMDVAYWNDTPFQKVDDMPIDLTIVIDEKGNSRTETLSIDIPSVDSWWNVGFIVKPGFKLVIAAGNKENYGQTREITIK